jgi:Tol biopolymer transport system component
LSWLSRTGAVLETIGKPGGVFDPRISPDQKSVLYEEDRQIVRWDMVAQTASALTNASVQAHAPIPSPDGQRYLAFVNPPRALVDRPLNGVGGDRILYGGANSPFGWSKDRRWVLTSALRAGKFTQLVIPAEGGAPISILNEAVQPAGAQFSPDGRWIVYSALVGGRRQIFVSSLPKEVGGSAESAGTWQISRDGGEQPVWRGDGKEIVYHGSNEQMMSVAVASETNQFRPGAPTNLFPVRLRTSRMAGYDITHDGSRFLIPLMPPGRSDEYSIGFIQNWSKLMNRAVEPE